MQHRHLIVMVKKPIAGKVKTRLGRGIGMTSAAWWFRHQSQKLIRDLQDPRWTLSLAVSPDYHAYDRKIWPKHLRRYPQGYGDLGQKMRQIIKGAPQGPVCLIGGDIPYIKKSYLNDAFRALGRSEFVFGPAYDGGFWLVGARHSARLPARFFQNVRWSSPHALQDSIVSLSGRSVSYVKTLLDVDTLADLRQLEAHFSCNDL